MIPLANDLHVEDNNEETLLIALNKETYNENDLS